MSYLVDKYLQALTKEYKNSKEVNIFCRVIIKEGHFNITRFYEELCMESFEDIGYVDWEKRLLKYKKYNDYRIRRLTVKNFRKYKSENDYPYLLDMVKKGNNEEDCSSIFIVGKNGVGKTSLFTALEYLFNISQISSMMLRAIDSKENYLPYGGNRISDVEIVAELNSKKNNNFVKIDSSDQEKKKWNYIDMSSFFCSEKDIYDIYRQHDLKDIYINNIGLNEVNSLINELDSELKIETEQELELTRLEHQTYDISILQIDILRISCRGYEIFNRYLGVLGMLRKFLGENRVIVEKELNFYKKCLTNKDFIRNLCKFFDTNKLLLELDYFSQYISQIRNYEYISSLSGIKLLTASVNLDRMVDLEVLLTEMSLYIEELIAPFQQAGIGADYALNNIIKTTIENIVRRSEQEVKKQILKKNQNYSVFMSNNNIKETIQNFRNSLMRYFKQDCDEFLYSCQKNIPPLLNKFTEISNGMGGSEKFEIIEKDNKFFAEIKCPNISEIYTTRPHIYYNSFRYKLFAISIKISLAFMMMKKYNMIAPIIIDDVFTASDFDNTINIDLFFEQLINTFKDIVNNDSKKLQIILFTHDEVVLNALKEAFHNYENKDFPFILGRLLNTSEILQEDFDKEMKCYKLIERLN